MDAEASHPDVLVADALMKGRSIGSSVRGDCGTQDLTRGRAHAVDFQVRDVKTHVEVLGHVPLGAGTNPPAGPVVVAARLRKRQRTSPGARALQRAKDVIGLAVVTHRRIAAVERSPPLRGPEVLVGCVEAPRRRQVDAGGVIARPRQYR